MRDFPFFTTEYGAASLILREIPYRGRAYIKLLDSLEPEKLLAQCFDFCRVVGAEKIFASGSGVLEKYPLTARILQMQCLREGLPQTKATARVLTQQTLDGWKQLYNEKMVNIPNASYMDDAGAQQMLKQGSGYWIYCQDRLIGMGKASGDRIDAVISLSAGSGADVVASLAKVLEAERICLQVAKENLRAVSLYQRLGFETICEAERWYQIL